MNSLIPILASIDGGGALKGLLVLLIIGIVLGIIHYLVGAAPFISALFKQVLQWLIILVAALVLINYLLSLVGYPLIKF